MIDLVSQKRSLTNRVINPVKLAFKLLCQNVTSPVSESLSHASDLEIARFKMPDPETYPDAESFSRDYLLVSYLSKYKGLQTQIDTKEVALSNFAIAESTCRRTNQFLSEHRLTIVDPILHRAQMFVAQVLGNFDIRKLDGRERWGPGAAFDLRRNRAYLDSKFAELPISVTRDALRPFKRAIENDLHWSELILGSFPCGPFSLMPEIFNIVEGSKVVTVDKNAKTDRTIAIEPRGNMFLQKSVGNYLRKRLKRFGVDLDDQGVNQELARDALDLGLATIDLSMASDTICQQLVFELLPFDWAVYLDQIRSRKYTLDQKSFVSFEKFSSMGNGFTFELESLLFYALVKASMENEKSTMSIYGDDIIAPSSDAGTIISTLAYCGFSTNVDKTFIEGPFRESCGRHYFDGRDVTPIYQKEIVNCSQSHIRFANRIMRLATRRNDGDNICPILRPVWQRLYDQVRYGWHPQIPNGTEGDDGYLVLHNDLTRFPKYDRNYGYRWPVFRRQVTSIPANDRALLAYALRLGCVTPSPYGGELASNDERSVSYARATRWIEPSWEFALS